MTIHLFDAMYISFMKDDPIIADIRKARDEISKRFGGDMDKIFAYLKEEEQKLVGKVTIVYSDENGLFQPRK